METTEPVIRPFVDETSPTLDRVMRQWQGGRNWVDVGGPAEATAAIAAIKEKVRAGNPLSVTERKLFRDSNNIDALNLWKTDLNPENTPPSPEQIAQLRAGHDDPKARALFDAYFGKGAADFMLVRI